MSQGHSHEGGASPLQKWIHDLLEPAENLSGRRSRAQFGLSRILDAALITLIIASSAAVVLLTVEDLPQTLRRSLSYCQIAATAAFTVEYAARLYAIPASGIARYQKPIRGRLRYAATPMELVDLAAIAPSYILLLTGSEVAAAALLLRLLRLLKLFRYSDSLLVFARVFRDKAGQLTASFFVTGILLVLASGVVYYCEREVQPEPFGSIPATMWWGIVTLTTVGYGDVSPITPVGQFFGALTAVVGIGLVALPSGILAGGFIEAFADSSSPEGADQPQGEAGIDHRCPHCGRSIED